jgi:hypothetical protein
VADLAGAAELTDRVERVDERTDDVERRLAELEAAVHALRGSLAHLHERGHTSDTRSTPTGDTDSLPPDPGTAADDHHPADTTDRSAPAGRPGGHPEDPSRREGTTPDGKTGEGGETAADGGRDGRHSADDAPDWDWNWTDSHETDRDDPGERPAERHEAATRRERPGPGPTRGDGEEGDVGRKPHETDTTDERPTREDPGDTGGQPDPAETAGRAGSAGPPTPETPPAPESDGRHLARGAVATTDDREVPLGPARGDAPAARDRGDTSPAQRPRPPAGDGGETHAPDAATGRRHGSTAAARDTDGDWRRADHARWPGEDDREPVDDRRSDDEPWHGGMDVDRAQPWAVPDPPALANEDEDEPGLLDRFREAF